MMAELKALSTSVLVHISKQLDVPLKGMVAVIGLLDEGATVPFIARYRKEVTGNLDEVQIRDVQEKLEYFRELEDRRETVLASIEEQGKLTPGVAGRASRRRWKRRSSRTCTCPTSPSGGPRPPSPASAAWNRWRSTCGTSRPGEMRSTPSPPLSSSQEKGVASAEDALEGARHIMAEWISENAEFRKAVRGMMMAEGMVVQPRHRRA